MKYIAKLLLCTVIWFTAINAKAQIDTNSIEGLYQYIFQYLDKSQVPTNYLKEYGVPIVPMETFNGTLTDNNTISM